MIDEKRNTIIDDLLLKYPLGPLGLLRKKDYRLETFRDYMTGEDEVRIVSDSENYGYDKFVIFDLSLHTSYQVHDYLSARLYRDIEITGGRKGSLSKKTKRLWYRIRDIVYEVKREGGSGIYKVYTGYADTLGHIFAKNKQDAKDISAMFFGHLADSHQALKVEFVKTGSPERLSDFNRDIISSLSESIETHRSTIRWCSKKISRMSATIQALTSVEQGQLNIITGGKCEQERHEVGSQED